MKPISEAHVAQPGLAVVDVAACDDVQLCLCTLTLDSRTSCAQPIPPR
ncbi:DUF6207 family protein [Streptomyces massasporeus]